MNKTLTLLAGAAGYVLGTRAGRERFEQIKDQADKVWHNPKVQKAAADAQDLAAEKAPLVKEKAAAAADRATGAATSATSKTGQSTGGSAHRASGPAVTDEPVRPGAVSNPPGSADV